MYKSPGVIELEQKEAEKQAQLEAQRYCPVWVSPTQKCEHIIHDENNLTCKQHVNHWGNPSFFDRVRPYLELQMLPNEALVACGVSTQTFRRWVNEYKNFGPFQTFMDVLEVYSIQSEARILGRIDGHGDKDWKALAYLLKTKRPERYGDRLTSRVDVSLDNKLELDADGAALVIESMLRRELDEPDDNIEDAEIID